MEGIKDEVSVKQVNNQVKQMVQDTRNTLKGLRETKAQLHSIKKAYEILLSDKYIDNINEAFKHKIDFMQGIVNKQKHYIALLKGNQTFMAKDRLAGKLEEVGRKVQELFDEQELLSGLIKLELALDKIEKKKSELEEKLPLSMHSNSGSGIRSQSKMYNFE